MPAPNRISVSPSSLSLTFNHFNNTFSGDNQVNVNAYYNDGSGPGGAIDSFHVTGDPLFVISDDVWTQFWVTLDNALIPTITGDYTYELTVTGDASGLSKIVTVYLKIINEDQTPPEDFVYKKKYFIDRGSYYVEIQTLVSPASVIVPIEINGTVKMDYQDRKDLHLEPIIASSIQMDLEASIDMSLEDLYSEDERQFKAIISRRISISEDPKPLFIGYIKPDGIFADYVNDRWILSIDAYDGLSTLKNLTFVGENGIKYTGIFNLLNIVKTCLARTGLSLPLNINCDIFYDGYAGNSILEETTTRTDRYYQNSSEPMDCESVLKSILQLFNASLFQMDGEWWIIRPIDVRSPMPFARYIDGIFDSNITFSPLRYIGSHIDGFEPFHCDENQRYTIAASVQAYRIYYEYGGVKSVFRNGELALSGSGLDIEGWNVNNSDGNVERLPSGYGLKSKTLWFGGNYETLLTLSQSIDINEGAVFKLVFSFSNESINSVGLRFHIAIGGKYLKDDGSWNDGWATVFVNNSNGTFSPPYNIYEGKGDATYEVTVKAPVSGQLDLVVYRDRHENGGGYFSIKNITLIGTSDGDVKGRRYTGRRVSKNSTVTKENVKVFNGDSISDLFVGTLYKEDGDTPTSTWYRSTVSLDERNELLYYNAEDNLRISPRPMIVFEGNIYGYLPYLSLISINNFVGKLFQPVKYSYDFSTNILSLSSREFSSELIPVNDFNIDVANDYGNETKVTIV